MIALADPRRLITDKLRSYSATHRIVVPSVVHRTTRYENNTAYLRAAAADGGLRHRHSRLQFLEPVLNDVDLRQARQRVVAAGGHIFFEHQESLSVGCDVVGAASDRADIRSVVRGGPRNSDSLLRWDPDQGEGVWHTTEATELSC